MRLLVPVAALLLAVAVAGCGGQKAAAPAKEAPKFVRLISVSGGDTVSLDPDTVKVNGPEVSAVLLFAKSAVKDGIKSESWDATLKPSERMIAVKAKMLYNEAGQVVSADTANSGWEYIIPDSDTERIMHAVVDYGKSRGLAVNATTPPYALPGYRYVAKSTANNAYYLYKPASVRTSGGVVAAEVLMINSEPKNGVKYSVATVNFRTGDKKYQTAAQALHDATGTKLSDHNDTKWYDIPPNSVYDMILDAVRK